jgi:hypothetical protein
MPFGKPLRRTVEIVPNILSLARRVNTDQSEIAKIAVA